MKERKLRGSRIDSAAVRRVSLRHVFARLFLVFLAASASAVAAPAGELNALILRTIKEMPSGGGYSTSAEAGRLLSEAIQLQPPDLAVTPERAMPSYCSGATYLVFAKVINQLIAGGALRLDVAQARMLLLSSGQRDGEGLWGRWNANGPGTARLFHELGLGRNFLDWNEARPGDFMKIFWTDEIGKSERGHSVIFLGTEREANVDYVRFWSSNKPAGYGEKRVPRRSVRLAVFSRLENPEALLRAPALARSDAYLASMLTKSSSLSELRGKCGM